MKKILTTLFVTVSLVLLLLHASSYISAMELRKRILAASVQAVKKQKIDPTQRLKDILNTLHEIYRYHSLEGELSKNHLICCMQQAIEAGADPNTMSQYGKPALSFAMKESERKVALLLLKCGADPNQKDEEGDTQFTHVFYKPNEIYALGSMLLEYGIDPNMSAYSTTPILPLHMAICAYDSALVADFMKHGADQTACDEHEKDAREIAVEKNAELDNDDSREIVRLLSAQKIK